MILFKMQTSPLLCLISRLPMVVVAAMPIHKPVTQLVIFRSQPEITTRWKPTRSSSILQLLMVLLGEQTIFIALPSVTLHSRSLILALNTRTIVQVVKASRLLMTMTHCMALLMVVRLQITRSMLVADAAVMLLCVKELTAM